MFNEIYERDVNTLGTARSTLGLLEEIGEMAEAVRVFEKYPKYFAGEAADVFSYIMGIANEHNIRLQLDSKPTMDFEAEFLRRYPGLCLQCGHEICVCPSVPESTVGRLSKELDLMPSEQIFALELPEAERRGREIGDSVLEGLGGLAALTLKLPLDRGETNRAMTVLCMKLSDEMRGQNASLANELQDAAIRIATDVRRPGSRSHGEASAHAVELLAGVWPLLSSAVIPDDNSLPSRLGRLFRTQSARIGIITALPKEFAAMRMMLDEQCMNPIASDPNDYVVGTIPAFDGTGNHVVVLTLLKDMGNNTAAAAATHLLRSFPAVEDVIMVGIAGGIPAPESPQAHVRLGDIVVSDKEGVVQFDNVKVDNSKISLRSTSSRPSARMIGAIKMLESERLIRQFPWEQFIERGKSLETGERPLESADKLHKWQNGVSEEIPHPRDPWRRQGFPKIHYGRIAASNMLLKNPDVRDRLRLECNVIGVEMEGSGIADAAWNAGQHYLIIRGICDYCDEMKNDSWQGYAAVVAAAYARTLISRVSAISYSASLSPDTTLKAES
jgi:nucleoside phosphorylase/NTP pyrophosphatase (non-canonical NTP hydrolase)